MGKAYFYLLILICVDLLFIITGQVTGTTTSIIFQAIANPATLRTGTYWLSLIGSIATTAGILGLIGAAAVTISTIVTKSDTLLFIPIAFTLALLTTDFITISTYLNTFSPILSAIIITPLIIGYVFIVLEWVKGKD